MTGSTSGPAIVRGALVGALLGAPTMAAQLYGGWGFGLSGGTPPRFMMSQETASNVAIWTLPVGAALGALFGAAVVWAVMRIARGRGAGVGVAIAGALLGGLMGTAIGFAVAVERIVTVSAGPPGTVAAAHNEYVAATHPPDPAYGTATAPGTEIRASITHRRQPIGIAFAGVAGALLGALAGRGALAGAGAAAPVELARDTSAARAEAPLVPVRIAPA